MEDLEGILRGKAGTRVVLGAPPTLALGTKSNVHKLGSDIASWGRPEVELWLRAVVRLPNDAVDKVLQKCDTGQALLRADFGLLHKQAGLIWGLASMLFRELDFLRASRHPLVQLQSKPYPWPYNGLLHPNTTALVVIDMQRDFLDQDGYVGSMGYDVSVTRKTIEPTATVLARLRQLGFHVIHTRESHTPDLADCPQTKHWRSMNLSAKGIGDQGPLGRLLIRGEDGWDFVKELKPLEGEVIIDKPGKGAFYATTLDLVLRTGGIRNLILCGVSCGGFVACHHPPLADIVAQLVGLSVVCF
jgi:nicotinamidase-related amidase